MNRRKFIQGLLGGVASVAIGMRMAQGAAKLTDELGKIYTWKEVKLGYTITSEHVDEGLYGELSEKYAAALAKSMSQTKEAITADIFNRAFTASG